MGVRGYRHTEEAKRRISESRRLRLERDGFLNTPETRTKISQANRGKPSKISPEGWARISEALRKRERSPEHMRKFTEAGHAAIRGKTDEQSPSWKGDAIARNGLAQWVARHRGKPRLCERCGSTESKKYHWVSKSGEPKRELTDWMRLCRSCHWKATNAGKPSPLKGRKRGLVPRSAFKKGQVIDNGHRFQKGQEAHNKGMAMPMYSGEKHPNWKGGITDEHQKIRLSLPYKRWRQSVFERDHFTCVMCGFRSAYHGRGPCDIRADHIKPFHEYPELRFDVSNGRTLCVRCDHKFGWQPWRKSVIQTERNGQLSFT